MNFMTFFLISALYCAFVSAKIPIASISTDEFGSSIQESTKFNYRLPNDTIPTKYEINIVTNVHSGDFNFSGTVTIVVKILQDTKSITLHQRQLTINSIDLSDDQANTFDLHPYEYDTVTEFLKITPLNNVTLAKDKTFFLKIQYNGELREDQKGFYRSSYKDDSGNTKWLATTQFESTDARHGFPCYDEPEIKANFTIHITHGSSYNAISNSVQSSRLPTTGDLVKTTFQTTPKMSTYLVAFIISDFEFTSNNNTTFPMRVFTHKSYLNQTKHALLEGEALLKAISDYVQVPYSLSKMDQAAIPDFRSGAMENWGLVTYREPYLLYHDTIHTDLRKFQVTTVISHEFSHQWFGDLVSPKWWTYIWLNEGFATLFENLGTDLVHPDWSVFDYFVVNYVQTVLRTDSKPDTRPMSHYTETQDGIANLFDDIAYEKSGAVLRMFLHALGENTFRKGINYYLTNNSYNSAEEINLFDKLQVAVQEDKNYDGKLNVSDAFGTWSNQKGFPVLHVQRSDKGLNLHQDKYDAIFDANANDSSAWWIPYSFVTSKNNKFDDSKPFAWLTKENKSLDHELTGGEELSDNDWVLFNVNQTGFYRVMYTEQNYNLLINELNDGDYVRIPRINRAQIIDDLLEFAYTARIPTKLLYNVLPYLKKETEYAPWVAANRAISELDRILAGSEKREQFRKIVSDVVNEIYTNTSLEIPANTPMLEKFTRQIAVNLACEFGVDLCLNQTATNLISFVDGQKLSQHNRKIILTNGIRWSNETIVDKLWEAFLSSSSTDERNDIIASFANVPNITIVERYLNKSIENFGDKVVSKAERLSLITSITKRDQSGVSLVIAFIHRNMTEVNTTVGSFTTILKTIAERTVTEDSHHEFIRILQHAKSNKLCTDKDVSDLTKVADEHFQWQKSNVKRFEDGLLTSSATKLAVLPSVLVLLFWFIRWSNE